MVIATIKKSVLSVLLRNSLFMQKAWAENEHPRSGDGRFANGGGGGKPRSDTKSLDTVKLKEFIDESLVNRNAPYKRVVIGTVNKDAQKRIEAAYGHKVNITNINIDNSSVCHAIRKPNHNLEPEDLLFAVDVINTATDISKSSEKHQDNDVLLFKKDIDGEITFLTEVRIKNGYLLVFDAWRQKKARSRKRPDAANGSPGLTSETSFTHNGHNSLSPTSLKKSSSDVQKHNKKIVLIIRGNYSASEWRH